MTGQGTFLDAVVEGLEYAAGSRSGVTDADGRFSYDRGHTITFRIGDIVFGSGSARFVMTPVNLVPGARDESETWVLNRVRFLLSLDDDAVYTNGIQVAQSVRDAAAGKSINFDQSKRDFESDPNVAQVVDDLTSQTTIGKRPLVDAAQAAVHLQLTLLRVLEGSYRGTYNANDGAATTSGKAGPQQGERFFEIIVVDQTVSLRGAVAPIGGGEMNLVGFVGSNGVFEATAQDGLHFLGDIKVDDSEDVMIVDGIWRLGGEAGGTISGRKD